MQPQPMDLIPITRLTHSIMESLLELSIWVNTTSNPSLVRVNHLPTLKTNLTLEMQLTNSNPQVIPARRNILLSTILLINTIQVADIKMYHNPNRHSTIPTDNSNSNMDSRSRIHSRSIITNTIEWKGMMVTDLELSVIQIFSMRLNKQVIFMLWAFHTLF